MIFSQVGYGTASCAAPTAHVSEKYIRKDAFLMMIQILCADIKIRDK